MVLIIKKGDKLEFIESWDYSKDNKERNLHKLIEQNPEFIITTEEENRHTLAIGSKMALPGGELDLLFVDNEGNLTLVELKRGRAPRKVIAQILDYASSLNEMTLDELENCINGNFRNLKEIFDEFRNRGALPSPEFSLSEFKENVKASLKNIKLIIASYKITEDIKRVANWLRDNYSVPIFCVEFEYFKRGENEFFIPRIIGEETSKRLKVKREKTTMQKKYYRFFDALIKEFKKKKPSVTERGATYDSWLAIPSGYGNSIHFEWLFHGREPNKKLGVELHFEDRDEKRNLTLLKHFKNKKKELEDKIGGKLIFEKWTGTWTRIYVTKLVGTLENGIKNEDIKRWAVGTMIKFYEVFKPELDRFVPTIK